MSINGINLPAWIAENRLFRTLFLTRKLYLIKTRFSHYSQFGEDISISRVFPKRFKGFFVDVGCFHPKKYNNTWQLYKKGWRGINIDIDSIKIEGFNSIRPKDININRAVTNTEGEISYYANGFYSSTTSLEPTFIAEKKGYIEKKTKCEKLTTILDQTKYRGQTIDFLSVDTEGHDLEVLRSLDFNRYAPKLIAVELYQSLLTEVIETELYKFLLSKNYCLVGWCGLTLLMASKSLQPILQTSASKL